MPPLRICATALAIAALCTSSIAFARPVLKPLSEILGEGGDPATVFVQGLELCFLKTLGKDAAARAAGWKFAKKPDGTYEKTSGSNRIVVEDGPGAACRALVYGRPVAAAIEEGVFNVAKTHGRTLKLNYAWRNFPALNQDWMNFRYQESDGFGFVTLIRNKPEKSGALPGIAYVAKVELAMVQPKAPVATEDAVRAGLDACSTVLTPEGLALRAPSNGFAKTSEQEFSRPLVGQGRVAVNWNDILQQCFVTVRGSLAVGLAAKDAARAWLRGEVQNVDVDVDGAVSADGWTWLFSGGDGYYKYSIGATVYRFDVDSIADAGRDRVLISFSWDFVEE